MLQVNQSHRDFLGNIRHWNNLRVAVQEEDIWVKGFTPAQLNRVELKSIPFARFYHVKDNLLFPAGSLLPSLQMPQLLWTPIERALPVKLHSFNHNLFEIPAQVSLRLDASTQEQKASVLLTDIVEASPYIQTAPAVRLLPLKWAVINQAEALITGTPLLPLNGKTYWQKGRFIYPAGLKPAFEILKDVAAAVIDSSGINLIWWTDEQHYTLVHPSALQPLTIASWRQTTQLLTTNPGL